MAKTVAYEPDPQFPSAYTFSRDDGTSLYAYGPEADALAAEIDRSAPAATAQLGTPAVMDLSAPAPSASYPVYDLAGPGPVAVNASGRSPQLAQGVDAIMGQYAPQQPSVMDVQPVGPAPMQSVPPREATMTPNMAPPPPPAPMPAAPPPRPFEPGSPEFETITRKRWVGGSPGVDPSRLRQTGVMVPTSQTRADVMPFDQEAAEARADADINLRLVRQAQTDLDVTRLQAERAQIEQQLPEMEAQAAEARSRADAMERGYQQERGHLDGMVREQAARNINATEWFDKKSPIGQFAVVGGMFLGALGSGLTGSPNWAHQIMGQQIEQNIAEQESKIRSGQAGIDNFLKQLEVQYGDMEQAKAAARIAMKGLVDMQMSRIAAQFGTEDAQLKLAEWEALRNQERIKEETEFRERAIGKASISEAFTQPRRATAGRLRDPTLQEMERDAKSVLGIEQARRGYTGEADPSKVNEAIAIERGKVGVAPPEVDKQTYQWSKDRALVAPARAKVDAFIKRMEAQQAQYGSIPGLGPLHRELGAASFAAKGLQRGAEALGVEEARVARQNRADFAQLKIDAQSAVKGIPSDKDQKLIDQSLVGDEFGTGVDVLRTAKQIRDALDRGLQELDAGIPPEVRAEHQRQLEVVPGERPPAVEPR